jgi:phage terminase large subunit-like protein
LVNRQRVKPSKSLLQKAVSRALKSGPSEPTDYVAIAIAYAEDAIDDRKRERYCEWIRLAAKRFLKDLKRAQGKRPPFNWSPSRANLHCEFIECLHHVEGTWSCPTIVLIPAQIFFVAQLFGFRNHMGGRRFSTALLAVARKNAKSTLAAAILLSCLCLEHEEGPQIISAATTGDQARKVFAPAKRMVEKNGELREVYGLEAFANSVARYENGGFFQPINSKASTQDGLNPSHTVMDEVHAQKTADLFNVLTSASGGRANPLWLYTTTEGYENAGPWGEIRSFAQNILRDVVTADHFLAVLFMLDDDDDEFDESKWPKANPLMETSKTLLLKVREAAIEAKEMPSKAAEFRIKRCNRRSQTGKGCINLAKFRKCNGEVDLGRLVGAPCWGAYDGASTTDMAAWRLLWLFEDLWWTWGRYWVPKDSILQRTERRSVNYQPWVESGIVTATEGDVIDYARVQADILTDFKRFGPAQVAFDPWNATQLAQNLTNDGVPMIQFIQGPKSYQPAWMEFERAYTSRTLRHGGDPVLIWNAANLVDRRDANMNFAPDKKRSPDKIDGIVSLLMCYGLAGTPVAKSFWE